MMATRIPPKSWLKLVRTLRPQHRIITTSEGLPAYAGPFSHWAQGHAQAVARPPDKRRNWSPYMRRSGMHSNSPIWSC